MKSEATPFDVYFLCPENKKPEIKADEDKPEEKADAKPIIQLDAPSSSSSNIPSNTAVEDIPDPVTVEPSTSLNTQNLTSLSTTPQSSLCTPKKCHMRTKSRDFSSPNCMFRSPFKSPSFGSPFKSPYKRKLSFGLPSSPDFSLDFMCGMDEGEGLSELFDIW